MSTINQNNNNIKINNFKNCLNGIFPTEPDHVTIKFNKFNDHNTDDTTCNNNNDNGIENLNIDIEKQNNKNENDDCLPSFLLLVIGFFTVIGWLVNVIFIKSKNKDARMFSISSLILFIISVVVILSLTIPLN